MKLSGTYFWRTTRSFGFEGHLPDYVLTAATRAACAVLLRALAAAVAESGGRLQVVGDWYYSGRVIDLPEAWSEPVVDIVIGRFRRLVAPRAAWCPIERTVTAVPWPPPAPRAPLPPPTTPPRFAPGYTPGSPPWWQYTREPVPAKPPKAPRPKLGRVRAIERLAAAHAVQHGLPGPRRTP